MFILATLSFAVAAGAALGRGDKPTIQELQMAKLENLQAFNDHNIDLLIVDAIRTKRLESKKARDMDEARTQLKRVVPSGLSATDKELFDCLSAKLALNLAEGVVKIQDGSPCMNEIMESIRIMKIGAVEEELLYVPEEKANGEDDRLRKLRNALLLKHLEGDKPSLDYLAELLKLNIAVDTVILQRFCQLMGDAEGVKKIIPLLTEAEPLQKCVDGLKERTDPHEQKSMMLKAAVDAIDKTKENLKVIRATLHLDLVDALKLLVGELEAKGEHEAKLDKLVEIARNIKAYRDISGLEYSAEDVLEIMASFKTKEEFNAVFEWYFGLSKKEKPEAPGFFQRLFKAFFGEARKPPQSLEGNKTAVEMLSEVFAKAPYEKLSLLVEALQTASVSDNTDDKADKEARLVIVNKAFDTIENRRRRRHDRPRPLEDEEKELKKTKDNLELLKFDNGAVLSNAKTRLETLCGPVDYADDAFRYQMIFKIILPKAGKLAEAMANCTGKLTVPQIVNAIHGALLAKSGAAIKGLQVYASKQLGKVGTKEDKQLLMQALFMCNHKLTHEDIANIPAETFDYESIQTIAKDIDARMAAATAETPTLQQISFVQFLVRNPKVVKKDLSNLNAVAELVAKLIAKEKIQAAVKAMEANDLETLITDLRQISVKKGAETILPFRDFLIEWAKIYQAGDLISLEQIKNYYAALLGLGDPDKPEDGAAWKEFFRVLAADHLHTLLKSNPKRAAVRAIADIVGEKTGEYKEKLEDIIELMSTLLEAVPEPERTESEAAILTGKAALQKTSIVEGVRVVDAELKKPAALDILNIIRQILEEKIKQLDAAELEKEWKKVIDTDPVDIRLAILYARIETADLRTLEYVNEILNLGKSVMRNYLEKACAVATNVEAAKEMFARLKDDGDGLACAEKLPGKDMLNGVLLSVESNTIKAQLHKRLYDLEPDSKEGVVHLFEYRMLGSIADILSEEELKRVCLHGSKKEHYVEVFRKYRSAKKLRPLLKQVPPKNVSLATSAIDLVGEDEKKRKLAETCKKIWKELSKADNDEYASAAELALLLFATYGGFIKAADAKALFIAECARAADTTFDKLFDSVFAEIAETEKEDAADQGISRIVDFEHAALALKPATPSVIIGKLDARIVSEISGATPSKSSILAAIIRGKIDETRFIALMPRLHGMTYAEIQHLYDTVAEPAYGAAFVVPLVNYIAKNLGEFNGVPPDKPADDPVPAFVENLGKAARGQLFGQLSIGLVKELFARAHKNRSDQFAAWLGTVVDAAQTQPKQLQKLGEVIGEMLGDDLQLNAVTYAGPIPAKEVRVAPLLRHITVVDHDLQAEVDMRYLELAGDKADSVFLRQFCGALANSARFTTAMGYGASETECIDAIPRLELKKMWDAIVPTAKIREAFAARLIKEASEPYAADEDPAAAPLFELYHAVAIDGRTDDEAVEAWKAFFKDMPAERYEAGAAVVLPEDPAYPTRSRDLMKLGMLLVSQYVKVVCSELAAVTIPTYQAPKYLDRNFFERLLMLPGFGSEPACDVQLIFAMTKVAKVDHYFAWEVSLGTTAPGLWGNIGLCFEKVAGLATEMATSLVKKATGEGDSPIKEQLLSNAVPLMPTTHNSFKTTELALLEYLDSLMDSGASREKIVELLGKLPAPGLHNNPVTTLEENCNVVRESLAKIAVTNPDFLELYLEALQKRVRSPEDIPVETFKVLIGLPLSPPQNEWAINLFLAERTQSTVALLTRVLPAFASVDAKVYFCKSIMKKFELNFPDSAKVYATCFKAIVDAGSGDDMLADEEQLIAKLYTAVGEAEFGLLMTQAGTSGARDLLDIMAKVKVANADTAGDSSSPSSSFASSSSSASEYSAGLGGGAGGRRPKPKASGIPSRPAPSIARSMQSRSHGSGGSGGGGGGGGGGAILQEMAMEETKDALQTVRQSETLNKTPAAIRALKPAECKALGPEAITLYSADDFGSNISPECLRAISPLALAQLPDAFLIRIRWDSATAEQLAALSANQLMTVLLKTTAGQCAAIPRVRIEEIKRKPGGPALLAKVCKKNAAAADLAANLVLLGMAILSLMMLN